MNVVVEIFRALGITIRIEMDFSFIGAVIVVLVGTIHSLQRMNQKRIILNDLHMNFI